jgi:hypothetical protein
VTGRRSAANPPAPARTITAVAVIVLAACGSQPRPARHRTGPPHPDRLLLTGLRRQLRTGQTVTIFLVFARVGHATLQVPVIEPTP